MYLTQILTKHAVFELYLDLWAGFSVRTGCA